MKIKKHGTSFEKKKKEQGEEFKCDKCGCEFYAKDDEYYVDPGYKCNSLTSLSYTITTSDTLVCSCPECHKICKKNRERNNWVGTTIDTNRYRNDSVTVANYDKVTLTGTAEVKDETNE